MNARIGTCSIIAFKLRNSDVVGSNITIPKYFVYDWLR